MRVHNVTSPATILAAILVLTAAGPADAQIVEAAVGGGFVFASGTEDPGPSVPTLNASAVLWPLKRWGVAVRWVHGLGEELFESPQPSGDRTYLGLGSLRYFTLTARHRRPLTPRLGLETGFGVMFGGHFAAVWELHSDPPRRFDAPDTFFGGFALEGMLSRRVFPHLTIKAGATYDFNFETNNFQPLVLAAVTF